MEISAVSFSRQISVKGELAGKMRWSRNAGNTLLAGYFTFEFYFENRILFSKNRILSSKNLVKIYIQILVFKQEEI